jgi:peptide chain release factor 3
VVQIGDLKDHLLDEKLGEKDAAILREDVELVDGVYGPLNVDEYLSGKICPVFFGSAINNFGVREMLDNFIRIAPIPQCRPTTEGMVCPEDEKLSGFVFKIHAKLDPRHRDRIAFIRYAAANSKEINIFITYACTRMFVLVILHSFLCP